MKEQKIITAYYRKSTKHGWRILIERKEENRAFVIAWSKAWREKAPPPYNTCLLGYVISSVPARGQVRDNRPLKSNDNRVIAIA